MRRFCGLCLACGLWMGSATTAKAQYLMPGDPVGFGRNGISNGYGYGLGNGYYPGLYYPTDNQGPSVYYDSVWSGLNGIPKPQAAQNGYKFSPPWSANYRQGQPRKKHHLFARLHQDD